jgi:transketolase
MTRAPHTPEPDERDLQEAARLADVVRRETIRLVGIAKSGHYTSVFSAAELLAALYSGVLRLDDDPDHPERDRLVLSKGHMAVGVYPLLAERGYFPADWLDGYTRVGNPLGDHPDMRRVPGVDFSSGSLGHGLSVAVGMATAARMRKQADTRIVALLGDQELNEGQIWEAAQTAGHYGLGNLIAIVDRNGLQQGARTEATNGLDPLDRKFEAFGWEVRTIDGNDVDALLEAFNAVPFAQGRPSCVIAHTTKGRGMSFIEDRVEWHHKVPNAEQTARALEELDSHE